MKYYRVTRTRKVTATVWHGKMTEEVDILAGSAAEALASAKENPKGFDADDNNQIEWDFDPEVADYKGQVLSIEVTEEFELTDE